MCQFHISKPFQVTELLIEGNSGPFGVVDSLQHKVDKSLHLRIYTFLI